MEGRSAFVQHVDRRVAVGTALGAAAAALAVLLLSARAGAGGVAGAVAQVVWGALAAGGCAVAAALLHVRGRIARRARNSWMAVGTAVAAAMLALQTLRAASSLATGVAPEAAAAVHPYLTWHLALAACAVGAVAVPRRRDLRRVVGAALIGLALLDAGGTAWRVGGDGTFPPLQRAVLVVSALAVTASAVAWLWRCGPRPTRVDTAIAAVLGVAATDLVVSATATAVTDPAFVAAQTYGAALVLVPVVGLLWDTGRLLGVLQRHEQGLERRLVDELELVARAPAPPDPSAGGDELWDARAVREVLTADEFVPVFQPIRCLATGDLLAVEALTRFPGVGGAPACTPDRWFAEAHRVGLGVELEIAALRKALATVGPLPDAVGVSVNLSPCAIISGRVRDELAGWHGRDVIVEITEHAVVDDYGALYGAMVELRELGARIAVDDAGAGFSSLRHIVRLGPDVIKLDVSLTRDIHLDPIRRSLAGSLAAFARQTDTLLVAEGIEHDAELVALEELGADAAQGYLVGLPTPVGQLVAQLEADAARP